MSEVWRKVIALIRRRNRPALTPSILALRPNSVTVAFISGTVPDGWTPLPGRPGVFYRPYSPGDAL